MERFRVGELHAGRGGKGCIFGRGWAGAGRGMSVKFVGGVIRAYKN